MRKPHCPLPALVTFLAGLLLGNVAQALVVDNTVHPLGRHVAFLEDPEGILTLDELLAHPDTHRFTPALEGHPLGRFTPVWIKLDLDFSHWAMGKRYYLFTRSENLYDIRLFRPNPDGSYRETVTGNNYPAASREVPAPRYGFVVDAEMENMTLYLRYTGGPGTRNFAWDLLEEETLAERARIYYLSNIACISAIAALLLFNISIALTLRKAEYAWYCGYVFFALLSIITLDGFGFLYIWPEVPALNDRALHGFNLTAGSLRLLTIMCFLDTAGFAPRMHRLALILLGFMVMTIGWVMLAGVSNMPRFAAPLPWAIGIIYGLVICGYAISRGVKLAIPLFITLVVPGVTAITQAVVIVAGTEVRPLDLQIAKVGFLIHILLFSLCLAARLKQETESRKQALHDGLTGLPGTRLLQERYDLAAALCRRQQTGMAVFFIDLDGFKAVNDNLGHAAGDQLLAEVGGRLKKLLRRTDTVARIGGDEFAVILTQLETDHAIDLVAEKLLAAVAQPCSIDGREARVSASIGIALYPTDGENLQELLKAADSAMYTSKRDGKNTYSRNDCAIRVAEPVERPCHLPVTATPSYLGPREIP